ncbi:cytochrome c556 [Aquamicrobium lusatiense]|jgi:cytochrome c556|uniref:Cytochrome c556 n=1 Tax=Aquamicrobium lusatiense TaxID=89772 RepID=A0A7W9S1R6_9HYPH|nr:cytochrome c [Aquamicrobium lusatiense]MBB6012295.1 cytochrome c556 [Aquamicrobium lusatiense]
MKKLLLAISIFAIAGSAAFADTLADRKALMKERGKLTGELSKVVKGETPFDAAAVLKTLQDMQANAEKFDVEALYPAGSDTGDTTAAPKIWEDPDGFKAAEGKFEAAVNAAVTDAPADVDALKAKFGAIGASCGACHETFRVRKG